MIYEGEFADTAHKAAKGIQRAMQSYKEGLVVDEDDLTGVVAGNLQSELQGRTGHLTWSVSILRHRRGTAAEERQIGADMLIHVSLNTDTISYSKGALIQAKRIEPHAVMRRVDYDELLSQCDRMLAVTPASFVFAYARRGMRCGSALSISGAASARVYDQCVWTSYRFLLEMFRCPIGDRRIRSARVVDLPIPREIRIEARALDG
jgi:hypothetical protein